MTNQNKEVAPHIALTIQGLVKSYGPAHAAAGIDLTARHGEVTTLLGPNGAGKSTAIACAVGLVRPDSGRVLALGTDPWHASPAHRARVGVMLQDGGLMTSARAGDLLRYASRHYACPRPIDELSERLGITDFARTMVRRLSGGQRQRLALALALLGRPELVFLDEPTAGMDPYVRRTVWELIRELKADGVAVVLTTHLMDEAEALSDHIVVIDRGRILADGTPRDVVQALRGDGTSRLVASFTGVSAEDADALRQDLQELAQRHRITVNLSDGGDGRDLEDVLLSLRASEPSERSSPLEQAPSSEQKTPAERTTLAEQMQTSADQNRSAGTRSPSEDIRRPSEDTHGSSEDIRRRFQDTRHQSQDIRPHTKDMP
ncbi:ABC transporter ATP-binding protein [Devriesea agamarum]|uniref:ABC transporter ATP-binding protein n=1 Tax=Devriesea agamarum TaxID=472569 RepID=UPI000A065AAB|nr:ABC transporter ATP-binding protein [Devriesea agamarum]